jgi:hypothetical protein
LLRAIRVEVYIVHQVLSSLVREQVVELSAQWPFTHEADDHFLLTPLVQLQQAAWQSLPDEQVAPLAPLPPICEQPPLI